MGSSQTGQLVTVTKINKNKITEATPKKYKELKVTTKLKVTKHQRSTSKVPQCAMHRQHRQHRDTEGRKASKCFVGIQTAAHY